MNETPEFKYLGKRGSEFSGELDTFPAPRQPLSVTLVSDEVTSLCPVTGQPDWYVIEVQYTPKTKCIESKSWKLYLQSFRDRGIFVEALAAEIADFVKAQIDSEDVSVTITQKPRGGVEIVVVAFAVGDDDFRDADARFAQQFMPALDLHGTQLAFEFGEVKSDEESPITTGASN